MKLQTAFFSAKPKLMNVEVIQETSTQTTCPTPLSFKRNGDLSFAQDKKALQADEDRHGEYFAASIRKGPFMVMQEDRVSNFRSSLTLIVLLVYF